MVEGRLLLQVGEDRHELGPGCFAWVPRQIPHTFANVSASPVRLLGIAVPGGDRGSVRRADRLLRPVAGATGPGRARRHRRPAPRPAGRPADQRGRRGRSEPSVTFRASSAADDSGARPVDPRVSSPDARTAAAAGQAGWPPSLWRKAGTRPGLRLVYADHAASLKPHVIPQEIPMFSEKHDRRSRRPARRADRRDRGRTHPADPVRRRVHQVTALTSHHQAMITGMTLSIIAVVLLIAGTSGSPSRSPPGPRGWPSPAACSASSARWSSCSRTASPPRLPPSLADSATPGPRRCSERVHSGAIAAARAARPARRHRHRPARHRRTQGRRAPLGRRGDRRRRPRRRSRLRHQHQSPRDHLFRHPVRRLSASRPHPPHRHQAASSRRASPGHSRLLTANRGRPAAPPPGNGRWPTS